LLIQQESIMNRERTLKVVIVVVGLLFSGMIYPLVMSLWNDKQAEYGPMMLSLYVTLGVLLLVAARNPPANRSLIVFTAWSSFAHAAVMAVQAIRDAGERGHLLGGVALFGVIGLVFIAFAPAKQSMQRASAVGA
jgi:hypothetical protein